VRTRLAALAAAVAIMAVALGIRVLSGSSVLDSSATLAQHSGTALYAAMIYAGVFVLFPMATPIVAGVAAAGFCWLVEFSQLTGVPAALSERSALARLALGMQFDASDLIWYLAGIVPLLAVHTAVRNRRTRAA
jgi:hypothetical protein